MAKPNYGKVGASEVLSNKWGRDIASARRAAETVETGREQLDVQSQTLDVQSQALGYEKAAFDQRNTIIAQNNEIIGLMRYVAEQMHQRQVSAGDE